MTTNTERIMEQQNYQWMTKLGGKNVVRDMIFI